LLSPETHAGLGSQALAALGPKGLAQRPLGPGLRDSQERVSGQFGVRGAPPRIGFPLTLEAFTQQHMEDSPLSLLFNLALLL